MRENPTELVVGGMVLAAAIGFLTYTLNTAGVGRGVAGSYPLTASFRSVDGVSVGSDVRLAGVKVGTVTGLDLNAETYRADMTIALSNEIAVPSDSSIAISSDGLLGDSFIEIIPGGALDNLEPGDEVLDTQGAVSLIGLLLKFVNSNTGSE